MKERSTERLHPAVWPAALLMLISVGRLPELFPFLAPLQLGKLAVLWAVAALALGPRDVGNAPLFDQRLTKLMVAWFVFAAVSVLWSVWRSYSLGFLLGGLLINLIAFFIIARTTTNTRTLRLFSGVLLSCAALLSLKTLLAAGAAAVQGRVAVSAAYDPNDLAMVLVMLLPLALANVFTRRGIGRITIVGLCGAVLVAVLLTGSRGGFLGLIAVAGYLFFVRLPDASGRPGPRFQPVKFAAAGFGMILLLAVTPAGVWERLATMTSLGQDYNVTDPIGRLAIWERGIEAMVVRPWGYGIAAFEAVEGQQGGRYKAAHNIWVEIGVELGVQGLILLVVVLATAFGIARRVCLQAARAPPPDGTLAVAVGLRGALVGYLVTGFFLSAAYAGVLFAVLGVLAGLNNLAKVGTQEPALEPHPTPAAPPGERAIGPGMRDGKSRGAKPVGGWRPISGGGRRRTSIERRS